jgi:hypothetical protein
VVPFGLRLEEYLKYRGLGKVFDVAIVSRLVPYKGFWRLWRRCGW